jgi:hypothetical protein
MSSFNVFGVTVFGLVIMIIIIGADEVKFWQVNCVLCQDPAIFIEPVSNPL